MFLNAHGLSDVNKGLIHGTFSRNPNWEYDWSMCKPSRSCRSFRRQPENALGRTRNIYHGQSCYRRRARNGRNRAQCHPHPRFLFRQIRGDPGPVRGGHDRQHEWPEPYPEPMAKQPKPPGGESFMERHTSLPLPAKHPRGGKPPGWMDLCPAH